MKTRLLVLALFFAAATATGVSAQSLPTRELSEFGLDLPDEKSNRHYLSYNLLGSMLNSLNLGYEWRRDEDFGLKFSLHGGFAPFPSLVNLDATRSLGGRVEARWYQPDRARPLYIGAAFGVSALFSRGFVREYWGDRHRIRRNKDRTTLFTPQLLLGYFHRSRRRLSCDFSLGVGFVGWRDNYRSGGLIPIPLPVHSGISLTWETGPNPIRYSRY